MNHAGQFVGLIKAVGIIVLLLTGHLQAGAVEDALERGDAAAARAALELEVAGRRDADLHRAHLEGLLAMRSGDMGKAEAIFRSILTVAPGFEPSRLQLVIVLEQSGKSREAALQAERLASTTSDARLREALKDRITVKGRSPKAGVDLRFAVLPSTNITGGPRAETVFVGGLPFRLDPGSREAAGVGLSFGLTGWRRWDLANDWQLRLSASADARLFETGLKPDEAEFGLRLDISRKSKRGLLSFGPRLAMLFQDDELARRQAGFGLAAQFISGPNSRIGFSAELLKQSFPQADYRDGTLARGLIGFRWVLRPGAVLSLDIPVLREKAVADHLSHRDLGFGLGLQLQHRALTIGLGASISKNRYDGVYPGFDVARQDRVTSVRVSLRHEAINWQGMTPELSITRERQDSNIPLHESWTTDVGLSLVKRF